MYRLTISDAEEATTDAQQSTSTFGSDKQKSVVGRSTKHESMQEAMRHHFSNLNFILCFE